MSILLNLLLLLSFLFALWPSSLVAAPNVLPNVIVMLADDMGMGDTSAYRDLTGNEDAVQVSTPSMDRLAGLGVRFTNAHTPASRCTPTRYGLLTGRYPWRSRVKHWVLFGSQGDPLIEPDRPTIATFLRGADYATGMVGKWHLGLRYRRSDGSPAAGWNDADLTQPLYDGPTDHGFEFFHGVSRSHGSSGPQAGSPKNTSAQRIGPGHISGRQLVSASGDGKRLLDEGPEAYRLSALGERFWLQARAFMERERQGRAGVHRPFFLYFASPSNHGPYTPGADVDGVEVVGQGRNRLGEPMGTRWDYIYENDVILGHILDYLEETEDPRRPGRPLLENTIVVFTSDNGAERAAKAATGPIRSNKGSSYEGGHRVPFMVSWPLASVGDGDPETPGRDSDVLFGLQDVFATLGEALGRPLPDLRSGAIGAEDSRSLFDAWCGIAAGPPRPLVVNGHKEAEDEAEGAIIWGADEGLWKAFVSAGGFRFGVGAIEELYDLTTDPRERNELSSRSNQSQRVQDAQDLFHAIRRLGATRLLDYARAPRVVLEWGSEPSPFGTWNDPDGGWAQVEPLGGVSPEGASEIRFAGGAGARFVFDCDVLLESVTLEAGEKGSSGGYYQVGSRAAAPVYCIDDDDDDRDQTGVVSDLGVLRAGSALVVSSGSFLGAEEPGDWRLTRLVYRPLRD